VGHHSVSHLSAELLQRAADIRLEHVALDGAQPAVQALMAGGVDLYFGTPPTFLPHIRSGKVRALATTAAVSHRGAALPDLPRMADTFPGFEVIGWHAVFAPAGTTPAQVKKLRARIVEVMSLAEVKSRLLRQGFRLATSTPEELAARVQADIAQWRGLLQTSKA
jgi:tripartite-type tricarboxylate transporter receptor subunit TctC